ncbi:unnamed protein product [Sphagnum troendelagicum]|uniref:SMODS and SLOG-associating 2TM effector domain-containing protein n=1 Tax=Sphagnum troendelagicum TaxID=128251 RepID=A0ABP0UU11_9BRYO
MELNGSVEAPVTFNGKVAARKFGLVGVVDEPKPEVGEIEGKELVEIKILIPDEVEPNRSVQIQKDLIPDEVEADRSLQIDTDPKLRLLLRDWEKNYKVARERIEKKETRTINAKAELYQLLGFYSVFQGVVLTAVAQSNTLFCLSSWAPASLSLLASASTVVGVHYKLTSYSRLKVALKNERRTAVDLRDQILELKIKGNEFDFSWFKGEYERRESRKKPRKVEELKPRYYCLIVLPLVLFSLIILASCFFVLCGPGSRNLP